MKKIVFCILVLLSLVEMPLRAQHAHGQVNTLVSVDNKLYHFGFILGLNMMDFNPMHSSVVDEDGNKVESFIIYTSEENRQLYAQYPDEQTIQRCAIMKDFGSQNDKVNEMWIRVKGNSVHWGIYVFLGSIVVLVLFFVIRTRVLKRARRNRNKNR